MEEEVNIIKFKERQQEKKHDPVAHLETVTKKKMGSQAIDEFDTANERLKEQLTTIRRKGELIYSTYKLMSGKQQVCNQYFFQE